jgi:hypothetical protein
VIQTVEENAAPVIEAIGDDGAVLKFEVKCRLD